MDKDDVEHMIALYKYLHDPNIRHDENWEKNMPKQKPKLKEEKHSDIKLIKNIKAENNPKEINKEDIKKTLNYLKQEIERIENALV